MLKHYLQFKDLTFKEYKYLFDKALKIKNTSSTASGLVNGTLVLLFEKSSTRTRISFEIGIRRLKGNSIFLSKSTTQLTRGETLEDTAQILSKVADAIVYRTTRHSQLERFAAASTVPVLNGLSNEHHPCQVGADILTFIECRGNISGKKVTWIGDVNNMLWSWMQAAKILGFELNIATFNRNNLPFILDKNCKCYADPFEACRNSDLIATDTMESMGCKSNIPKDQEKLRWKVNEMMLNAAKPEAIFMHCLPAHRNEEVSTSVIDGSRSAVYLEATNRLYFQNALLNYLSNHNSKS